MKLLKLILTFLTLLTCAQLCLGQEKPEPILSEKWVKVYCERSLGNLDNFFMELQNDTTATTLIVIYYGDDSLAERFKNENQIIAHAEFRKFDSKRLKIVSVNRGDRDVEIDFWRIPAGADLPPVQGKVEELSLPNKAFRFGFPGALCPFFSEELYKKYLEKYPDYHGNVVIYGRTIREAKKNGKWWIKRLVDEHGINRNRLKVFYSTARIDEEAEFWLVPPRKKKVARVLQ
jgi:hypothetical protein